MSGNHHFALGAPINYAIPDYINYIVAWRAFVFDEDQNLLVGPIYRQGWTPNGATEATCRRIVENGTPFAAYLAMQGKQPEACKLPPESDCTCGLYGYWSLKKTIKEHIDDDTRYFKDPPRYVALCRYWGVTEAYRTGLRSQFAEIKAIAWANPSQKQIVKSIADIYGIEALHLDKITGIVNKYGVEFDVETLTKDRTDENDDTPRP
jgi:hypothetical protein